MGAPDFRRRHRRRVRRRARQDTHQQLFDDEKMVDMVLSVTLYTVGIVASDAKERLTTELFLKSMDRLDELFATGEIHEQLKDPDAPEFGKQDQYVTCAILMYWKLLAEWMGIGTEPMRMAVRQIRRTVERGGLRALPSAEAVIERRAKNPLHAAILRQHLQGMLRQLAEHRARIESPDFDPEDEVP